MAAPGVHDDLDESTYFASPALSCSGAKLLLPPNCPAMYRWRLDNPQENKQAFDVGHAAHAKVLGVGAQTLIVEADNWMSKAAKAARDEAYTNGLVPLLRKDADAVDAMAQAVLDHPVAASLFEPGTGTPELSLFWHDERFGIDKRARLDWLRPADPNRRALVGDLKTCASADPSSISKTVVNYGYDMQAAHYSEAVTAAGLADDVVFLFVFVEKTAPHLITICQLDSLALERGRRRMDRASEVFAECVATDTWPGYSTDIELISLPKWATWDMEHVA